MAGACDSVEMLFTRATEYVKRIASTLSPEDLLEFYGFYKQATVGPCTVPKPSWYDFEGKQKWGAWSKLDQLSRTDAMYAYCAKLTQINTNWEDEEATDEPQRLNWVATSCLPNLDPELADSDKSIFDWVKEGDIEKIKACRESVNINELDESGLALLHWATDRGNLAVVELLITTPGANVNVQDSEGQTPLHYAASCDYLDIVSYLLANGAKPDVRDNSDTLPVDLTVNEEISELLVNGCSSN